MTTTKFSMVEYMSEDSGDSIVEYTSHSKEVNDKYIGIYKADYMSPQKARKNNICVRERKRVLRCLQRRYTQRYNPHTCWIHMFDLAGYINDCRFNKDESVFMKQYFKEMFSFIFTETFKKHFTYFFIRLVDGSDGRDVDYVLSTLFGIDT